MVASSDSPRKTFAATVTRMREARGMTQEQLAWAAGLHQSAVARIEAAATAPNFTTILKLARALEARPADLFADID